MELDYETFHHHVLIGELEPSTTYYYKVGDGQTTWSQEFKFQSAPIQLNNFTFAVFGDLGVDHGDSSVNFLNSMKDQVSLIWHGGDISYVCRQLFHLPIYLLHMYLLLISF